MDRNMLGSCGSRATWIETAPPQLITVRRRALRELALDTILEETAGTIAGHAHSAVENQRLLNLHQHRHAVAFAQ